MSEEPGVPTPSPPRKRSLRDNTVALGHDQISTPSKNVASGNSALPQNSATSSPLSSVPSSTGPDTIKQQNTGSVPGAVPTKRRKLTPQEKLAQQQEKEAKDKDKAEAKLKREEQKRVEDEEKRKKAERKEEKKRVEDFKKQETKQKKADKAAEKAKKESAQLRLNQFFGGPKAASATPGNSSSKPSYITKDDARRKSLSLEPGGSITEPTSSSPLAVSEFDTFFLPFSVPSHTRLAPENAHFADRKGLQEAQDRLDNVAATLDSASASATEIPSASCILEQFREEWSIRGYTTLPVKDIVARMHGSSNNPIDLTEERSTLVDEDPNEMLRAVNMKYIHFGEDVRPPYFGTCTKAMVRYERTQIARNPLRRSMPETNYDYDSEAEWEEPEEGEDLGSEGEEDMDSNEGDEDMEEFLDDEDDIAKNRRRLITGDLEPVFSGLCWEDASGVSKTADGRASIFNHIDTTMTFLLEPQPSSIDPYSTRYWQPEPSSVTAVSAQKESPPGSGLMNPPRLPLHARPNGLVNGANIPSPARGRPPTKTDPSLPKAPKRLIPDDLLPEFRDAIDGSDLTKIALIEALKKKFPKVPKAAITDTLPLVATRVGAHNADKRWVVTQAP